jgi:hypothetical protein
MSEEKRQEHLDSVRRRLLKSSLAAGGFMAAGHLPYVKPAAKSFFGVRSAWAQPTGVTSAQFTGTLVDLGGGLGTGQDGWELSTTQANTTLTIDVAITAGAAAPEIGLFAPGVPTTGVNLLTGTPGGYTGPFPVVVVVNAIGDYTIAIEDSNPDFLQAQFSYQIDVSADLPFFPGGQVIVGGSETLRP